MKVVVFVIGRPASGKTTLLKRVKPQGWTVLKVSRLLRDETGPDAHLIQSRMAQGLLVPSDVTIRVLLAAMRRGNRFIVDGFPQSMDDFNAFSDAIRVKIPFCLYVKCSEQNAIRWMNKWEGPRKKFSQKIIQKRMAQFRSMELPVINWFGSRGLLRSATWDTPSHVVKKLLDEA